MGTIEGLYIFDEFFTAIFEHVWKDGLPPAATVLPLYLSQPAPRPPVSYFPQTDPATFFYTITRDNLHFAAPTSDVSCAPVVVLEFLHRVADALTDFLGSPLLSTKVQSSYDTVAQLCAELVDSGFIATTEVNALRDLVEAPSWMKSLLGGVGLPSTSPSLSLPGAGGSLSSSGIGSSGTSRSASPHSQSLANNSNSSIPWRRANVRHTSNELYVDIIETLRVLYAPSGLPLQALVSGSVAFTAKVSGIPDLLMTMSTTGGGRAAVGRTMDLPVFHPCVRLGRWRTSPGELSFVPPDGRFVLAGYECDLLGENRVNKDATFSAFVNDDANGNALARARLGSDSLNLPAQIQIDKSLGDSGAVFEVRLSISSRFGSANASTSSSGFGSSSAASSAFNLGSSGNLPSSTSASTAAASLASNLSRMSSSRDVGTSNQPTLQEVAVTVFIPAGVRNLADLRTTRGDATYSPGDRQVIWRLRTKETSPGTATLRAGVIGAHTAENSGDGSIVDGGPGVNAVVASAGKWDYSEKDSSAAPTASFSYQADPPIDDAAQSDGANPEELADRSAARRRSANAKLMPTAVQLSFQVKGWLASGLKVDSLVVNTKTSRGLGAGVTPYKGVKYLTVSEGGVELRC